MTEASDNAESAIRTRALRMVYHPGLMQRSKVALHGLDLDVPRGSIYGFLGQNGAGKTSTIKILVALQMASAGRAWILGTDVARPAARQHIGFMPENPYFYEYLTAIETLVFYGKLSGMHGSGLTKKADALIEQFGLKHARNTRMGEFSKGMRQRLGLAQAVLHEPAVVILDEPMSGLDPLGRRDIRNEILALRDRGCTVFFSSHILGDVADICDRVCIIHKGLHVAEGPLSALLNQKVVEVEMAFSGIGPEGLPKLAEQARRAWHDGRLYRLLVADDDEALRLRAEAEAGGGTLRALIPHHESLEEYFVRVTGEEGELKLLLDRAAEAVSKKGRVNKDEPSAPGTKVATDGTEPKDAGDKGASAP